MVEANDNVSEFSEDLFIQGGQLRFQARVQWLVCISFIGATNEQT